LPGAIAFLPWVYCQEPIELGAIRLLPYVKGHLPGNLPNAAQNDIDAVIGAYATGPNHPVQNAALLELGEWQTGMSVEGRLKAFFRARDALAFSALAKRRLFRGHFDYCNTDTYSLVVQGYQPGQAGSFAFDTRRRDGSTGYMWSSQEFAFHRPNHVSGRSKIDLDKPLLTAIMAHADSDSGAALQEAIREFNQANTDSSDIRPHVELVIVKSAFEWLLTINTGVDQFVAALFKRLDPILGAAPSDGPLAERWRKRWPRAKRPLEAWARDFCDLRGAAAHGARDAAERFVWNAHTHLAFASIFFPLAFKKRLADDGVLALDAGDRVQIQGIEELLMVDPFTPEAFEDEDSHPWAEFQFHASFQARAERIWRK
jgi:hypothetical protein